MCNTVDILKQNLTCTMFLFHVFVDWFNHNISFSHSDPLPDVVSGNGKTIGRPCSYAKQCNLQCSDSRWKPDFVKNRRWRKKAARIKWSRNKTCNVITFQIHVKYVPWKENSWSNVTVLLFTWKLIVSGLAKYSSEPISKLQLGSNAQYNCGQHTTVNGNNLQPGVIGHKWARL